MIAPYPSFHPLLEGRQHAFGPHLRFDPGPPAPNLSGLLSPRGHWRRVSLRRRLPHSSTFLRPLAPRPLQTLHRYYGRSDSCSALLTVQVSLVHVPGLCRHSASNHLAAPRRRFDTLPLSAAGLPCRVRASPLPSRLAERARPNRVRHPADWLLTSGCSPPRLAATQLPSVTGRRAYA
jgi:hypothetical protein